MEITVKAGGARRGIIAVKKQQNRSIEKLKQELSHKEDLELLLLDDLYPAGGMAPGLEQLLVYETTGRLTPPGGLPADESCRVLELETLLNIHQAVVNERPVTRRLISCCGEVARPSVVRAHIGSSFREIIELCGGATCAEFVMISGGPIRGTVTTDLDTPVSKQTGAVIVLPPGHKLVQSKMLSLEFIIKRSKAVCLQCGLCTELCPIYLLGYELQPHKIMRQINYGLDSPPETIYNACLCIECGLCELYACPLGLSPRRVNAALKQKLSEQGIKPGFEEMAPAGPGRHLQKLRNFRRVPTSRLIERLNLSSYARPLGLRALETNPGQVELLLKQGGGTGAVPVVKVGDIVQEGNLIADAPEARMGALHTGIAGRVVVVDKERVIVAGLG
ncbi:Ion-translocating oxidoreductase complex subunit C [subsurface metagenome]